ncbi:hypothetical protein EYC80_007029 [Monilinia laxa]|uniref:Uncharacterized protein n=1 Tax=Monilinia laxa TaxID=61186 RepID=A0A5N6JZY6_MONLA|nr:hypothetical protein EYC80_007029 [Monilinia laxa]
MSKDDGSFYGLHLRVRHDTRTRTRRHRHDKLIQGDGIQLTRGNFWLGTLANGGGDSGLYLRLVGMGRMEIPAFMLLAHAIRYGRAALKDACRTITTGQPGFPWMVYT